MSQHIVTSASWRSSEGDGIEHCEREREIEDEGKADGKDVED
jgi:hypothetical protein